MAKKAKATRKAAKRSPKPISGADAMAQSILASAPADMHSDLRAEFKKARNNASNYARQYRADQESIVKRVGHKLEQLRMLPVKPA